MWPPSIFSSVIRMRRIVVLPDPDGPISASFSPGMTCIDRPSSTLKVPKLLEMASTLMMGAGNPFPPSGEACALNDAKRAKSCQLVKLNHDNISGAAQIQGNLRSAWASDGEQQMLRIAKQKLGDNAEARSQFPFRGGSERDAHGRMPRR